VIDDDEIVDCSGLLSNVTAYCIRILTDNPWEGGGGYSYEEVGNMTVDQINHRLCKIELLEKPLGKRITKISSDGVLGVIKSDKDGFVKAKASDGTEIKLKTTGKSKVQMIREKQAEEKANKKPRQQRREKGK